MAKKSVLVTGTLGRYVREAGGKARVKFIETKEEISRINAQVAMIFEVASSISR